MENTFFFSDSHYSHTPLVMDWWADEARTIPARIDPRTGQRFESVESHDQFMIDQHNSVVSDQDKVYCAGDFCFSLKTLLRIRPKLNGSIILIAGNHDKITQFANAKFTDSSGSQRKVFKDIRLWNFFNSSHKSGLINSNNSFVLSHIPLMYDQFRHKVVRNVHGHIHNHNVRDQFGTHDKRYVNICVEKIGYKPVSLRELLASFK